MKNKFLFLFITSFILVLFQSFELPKNINKKVTKEIKSTYEVENFSLESVSIPSDVSIGLDSPNNKDYLLKIVKDSITLGYAFIGKAVSKVDYFDYLVLFDTEMIIKKTKVLIYREDYGAEIGSKRWLKQFIGLDSKSQIEYGNEIIPISGATISAEAMTIAINDLLKSISILKQKEIL